MNTGNNSIWTKILFVLSLFTAVSPIDAIPDVIPILGQIDDAIAIPVLIILAVRTIVNRRKRKQAEAAASYGSANETHRGFENAKYAGEDLGGESFYRH